MTTLKNAAAVLEIFSDSSIKQTNQGISFTEIMQVLGLPKSTTSRLLTNMERCKLLEREPDSRLYHVGELLLAVSSSYLSTSLIDMAAPYMLRLSQKTTCTGYISILDDQHIVVMRMFPGSQYIRVVTPAGSVCSVAETAIGRALLARKTEDEIREMYKEGYFVVSKNAPQTLDELLAAVEVVRQHKWSFACNENFLGVRTVATAIFNKHRNETVGLCLSFPASQQNSQDCAEIIDGLVGLSKQLARKLGDNWFNDENK